MAELFKSLRAYARFPFLTKFNHTVPVPWLLGINSIFVIAENPSVKTQSVNALALICLD